MYTQMCSALCDKWLDLGARHAGNLVSVEQ